MNTNLDKQFTRLDVKEALSQMEPLKSPFKTDLELFFINNIGEFWGMKSLKQYYIF